MAEQQNDNWMPLESNPEVINEFIQKMGLKTEEFCFQELMSTEEWALEMVPKPSLGVVFLFEVTPVQNDHKNQQADSLKPEQLPQDIFFMKQKAHNACGTIALFHIILNALKTHPNIIVQNSQLDKFRNDSLNKSAEERGALFKSSNEIKQEHRSASSEGQSQSQESVDSHFIAFIQRDGHLYEMDGFKKCPVDHGQCTEEQILPKASQVIQQFMQRDPDNINFSMIVLAKKPEE